MMADASPFPILPPLVGGAGFPLAPVVQGDQQIVARAVRPEEPVRRTGFGGTAGFGTYPGFGAVNGCGLKLTRPSPYFAWLLRFDPTLNHVFESVCGPAMTAPRIVQVEDLGAGQAACDRVRQAAVAGLMPFVERAMPGAVEATAFGCWTQEVVWARQCGRVDPIDAISVLPGEGVLYVDGYRRLTGAAINGAYRDSRYLLHVVHRRHLDPVLGWSNNAAALQAWYRAQKSALNADATERKASGVQLLLYIAEGAVPIDPETNEPMDPVVLGRRWIEAAARGESLVLPKWAFPKESIESNPALADLPAISHELLDFGNLGPAIEASLARMTRCDTEMWRAWGVSPRVLDEAKAGGFSDAGEHASAVSQITGRLLSSCLGQINEQVSARWQAANFPGVACRVRVTAGTQDDDEREHLQAVSLALLGGVADEESSAMIDRRKLFERVGIALLPDDQAQRKLLELREQKQQAAEKLATQRIAIPNGKPTGVPPEQKEPA